MVRSGVGGEGGGRMHVDPEYAYWACIIDDGIISLMGARRACGRSLIEIARAGVGV